MTLPEAAGPSSTRPHPTPSHGAQDEWIVKSIVSGDTVILRGRPVAGPPPELSVSLAGVSAPRSHSKTNPFEEPFAFESREYLRKLLVGQRVIISKRESLPNSNHSSNSREIVSLVFKGPEKSIDVACQCLEQGWVRLHLGRNDSRFDAYHAAEAIAKKDAKGIWSSDKPLELSPKTLESKEDLVAFCKQVQGKPLKGIVEYIRDGSTVKVLLTAPHWQYVTLMMAGIKCPGYKKVDLEVEQEPPTSDDKKLQFKPMPFADEARFYTESRLLQRDVEVVIEGFSFPFLIGTIRHPAGLIAEALLGEGLAELLDWSLSLVSDKKEGDRLLKAEQVAKEKQIRLFKGFNSAAALKKKTDKEFSAKVIKVVSGESLVLLTAKGDELRVFLSSIRQPKLVRPTGLDGKPDMNVESGYNYEAKEWLRSRLIGKSVHVTIDYIKPASDDFEEKTCVTLKMPNGRNAAEMLVAEGLASVIHHRADDPLRSSEVHLLNMAEEKAIADKKGIHSAQEPPVRRTTDASENVVKAHSFLPSLERARHVPAVVEYVAHPGRFRLFVPKLHCRLTFLLSGIQVPREDAFQPLLAEALTFVNRAVLQHTVHIDVESVDKNGAFVGSLFTSGASASDDILLTTLLLERGYAKLYGPAADRSPHVALLKSAEEAGCQAKAGLWAAKYTSAASGSKVGPDEAAFDALVGTVSEMVICHVEEPLLYMQLVSKDIQKLERLMSDLQRVCQAAEPCALPAGWKSAQAELILAKSPSDGLWYRAKVKKDLGQAHFLVSYPDYGNSEKVKDVHQASVLSGELADLFKNLPAQAKPCKLFHVTLASAQSGYQGEALKSLYDLTQSTKLSGKVEGIDAASGAAWVTLTDSKGLCINVELVRLGLAYVKRSVIAQWRKEGQAGMSSFRESLLNAQHEAKSAHVNLWKYGDIAEDDDEDR